MAKADMSASRKEISVSSRRCSGRLATLLYPSEEHRRERCFRTCGAMLDMENPVRGRSDVPVGVFSPEVYESQLHLAQGAQGLRLSGNCWVCPRLVSWLTRATLFHQGVSKNPSRHESLYDHSQAKHGHDARRTSGRSHRVMNRPSPWNRNMKCRHRPSTAQWPSIPWQSDTKGNNQ